MLPEFKAYQQQVVKNAKVMAGGLCSAALISFPAAPNTILFLLSLIKQGVTGKDADAALGRAHITVNKNAVR